MDKPMSGIGFRLMTLVSKVRDSLRPRIDLLKETGLFKLSAKGKKTHRFSKLGQ